MNGAFLKLFAHDFFFTEPGVFSLTLFIYILAVGSCRWGRWWLLTLALCVSCLGIRSGHIKHNIIEVVVNIIIFFLRIVIVSTSIRFRWILELDINNLVILQLHVFFYEVKDGFTQTNLVVETGRSHEGRWLCTIAFS